MNLLRGKEKHTREVCAHLQEQDKTTMNKKKTKNKLKDRKIEFFENAENGLQFMP